MARRRYRTYRLAQLDRLLCESEAIRRAIAAGARWANVYSSQRIVDDSGMHVWEVVVRVGRRRPPPRRREGKGTP